VARKVLRRLWRCTSWSASMARRLTCAWLCSTVRRHPVGGVAVVRDFVESLWGCVQGGVESFRNHKTLVHAKCWTDSWQQGCLRRHKAGCKACPRSACCCVVVGPQPVGDRGGFVTTNRWVLLLWCGMLRWLRCGRALRLDCMRLLVRRGRLGCVQGRSSAHDGLPLRWWGLNSSPSRTDQLM
jgi:hypothetical protein